MIIFLLRKLLLKLLFSQYNFFISNIKKIFGKKEIGKMMEWYSSSLCLEVYVIFSSSCFGLVFALSFHLNLTVLEFWFGRDSMSYFLLLLFLGNLCWGYNIKAWRTATYKEVRLRTGPLAKLFVQMNTRKFSAVD